MSAALHACDALRACLGSKASSSSLNSNAILSFPRLVAAMNLFSFWLFTLSLSAESPNLLHWQASQGPRGGRGPRWFTAQDSKSLMAE